MTRLQRNVFFPITSNVINFQSTQSNSLKNIPHIVLIVLIVYYTVVWLMLQKKKGIYFNFERGTKNGSFSQFLWNLSQ